MKIFQYFSKKINITFRVASASHFLSISPGFDFDPNQFHFRSRMVSIVAAELSKKVEKRSLNQLLN